MNLLRGALIVCVLFMGLFLLSTNAQAAWESEMLVDDYSVSGQDNDIVLDSEENPVVLYDYNGVVAGETVYQLKYAVKEAGEWTTENIISTTESNIGWEADLVLAADDTPHVAFFQKENWEDEDEGDYTVYLKHATLTDAGWQIETIAQDSDPDNRPSYGTISLRLNEDGYPAIVYTGVAGSYNVKYVVKSDAGWASEDVDATLGCEDAVFEYDSLWQPHVFMACRDNYETCDGESCHDNIIYHRYKSGGWITEIVDVNEDSTSSGYDYHKHLSVAMDTDENFHILFHDMENERLRYATNPGNVWNAETVDDDFVADGTSPLNVYFENSIIADSDGDPHIAYYDFNTNNLRYAKKADGVWSYAMLFAEPWENEGGLPSITIDSDDYAHISYIGLDEGADYAAKYAHYIPEILFATKARSGSGKKAASNEKIIEKDHSYLKSGFAFSFTKYPSQLQEARYYLKSKKYKKYPKKLKKKKKRTLKKYWRVTSNLKNYNNPSNKFNMRMVFAYSQAEVEALQNRNSKIKEKHLKLKYYNRTTKKWKKISKARQDKKRNFFYLTLKQYQKYHKKTLFAISK